MTRVSEWSFRLLGPVAARRGDREVDLGGAKQRALLAILLLRRGEIVSAERLIDELWGEAPPPGAAKTLQMYVSRLRKALGDGIVVRRADAVVVSGCICSNGRQLVADLRRVLRSSATLIGTDNFTGDPLRRAGAVFDGMYITFAGRPPEALPPGGLHFLAQLFGGRRLREVDPYVAHAAQATEILLEAIAKSNGSRASVTHELLTSRVTNGILGSLSFDTNGDPVPAPIAIYRVDSKAPHDSGPAAELVLDRVIEPPVTLVR